VPTVPPSVISASSPQSRRDGLIGVAVIDALPMFRDAVCRAIRQRPRLQLAGEAAEARDALALLRGEHPDVAVVDAGLPGLSAERLLTLAVHERLSSRFVLVVGELDPMTAYKWLALGARCCVLRTATADDFERAIIAAAEARTYLADAIQHAVAGEIRIREHEPRPLLSPREHEVLQRIAAGQATPAMSKAMYLSVSTVRTHVAHLLEKLEAPDRASAVANGMRRGLID
jgi:two-component system, NarL family, nitrate/nitrite response regulator NarL